MRLDNFQRNHFLLVLFLISAANPVFAESWFVKAAAKDGGDGSERSPFNTLADVEAASGIGDTIFIMPSPDKHPALDGGIVLKDGQKLKGKGRKPRLSIPAAGAKITNSTGIAAVILASNNVVEKLHIDSAAGLAIFGDNVAGSVIQDVLVTEANASNFAGASGPLCDTVGLTVVRGCGVLAFLGVQARLPAISFLHDDGAPAGASHLVSNTRVDGVNGTGIVLVAAGYAEASLTITDSAVSNTRYSGGIVAIVFQQGQASLEVRDVEVNSTGNDGIALVTGFLGSGFYAPISDGRITADIDSYRFTGSGDQPPGGSQTGIEVYVTDYDSGEAHVKMRNSQITNGFITGIQLFGDSNFQPSSLREFTFDFGCINVDDPDTPAEETCEDLGFESSPGNNSIFGNGPLFSNNEVQIFGPFTAIGQGNWWGNEEGLDACVLFPETGDCVASDNGLGSGDFDARFPLTKEPR